ncbi:MAG: DNA polymerase elongation subunit (family B) [Thermoplasmata archaeon HGW-Thermoplasmata-1]|nr:MAG: DNA polymerase elongation subunit (family B) [Thermoplasmata archaeon HGW-Thermoplasmata-1]
MSWILKEKASLSPSTLGTFNEFLAKYAKASRSFHFGSAQDVVYIHPMSFDTFHAARRFYSFLDDFSLKALAPFLGINIDERVYLTPSQMALDDRTLEYNKHDVQEQLGVTMRLIQQALPLAFTTGMQMEELMTSGAVKMWDHMSLIRAAKHRRIMPAMARALSIAQTVHHRFGDGLKRREIADFARNTSSPDEPDKHMKEFARVAKYGEEMPEYVEYPLVVFNPQGGDSDEMLGYHIPGGMTLKPDTELDSDFIPWYHVVVADVGAMYPTILRARNVGGDSVRLAGPNEEPDDWIWLKRLPASFLESNVCRWREVGETDRFADVGYMLGVKISKEPGVVNLAMSAIIKMIGKIKRELKEAEVRHADRESLGRLKMSYQSLKGARNAGTHGIMAAATVSCRQFNVWGAAMITTTGQAILDDTLKELQDRKIRVVYGDTDGIYVACSKSMHDVGGLARAVGIEPDPEKSSWMTLPENAVAAIDFCNDKWRRELDYSDFELEPEEHGAMIFVKHKNYLIFDEKKGEFAMTTKGNNFKGSDKAELARIVLEEIMRKVLLENSSWESEESARRCVKASIKRITRDAVAALDMSKVNLADLTLVQSVQPSKRYKTNQDGALSTFAERTKALEELLGRQITATARFKFVVTKKPLPGIRNPSKSGVKPIDYMYPVELLTNRGEIDLAWYKNMVENYVKGAFGLPDLSASVQKGLSEWF